MSPDEIEAILDLEPEELAIKMLSDVKAYSDSSLACRAKCVRVTKLKHRLKDLANVLRRPVETAPQSGR